MTQTSAAVLTKCFRTHLQDFLQLAGGFDGHRGGDEGVHLLPGREEVTELIVCLHKTADFNSLR